MEYIVHSTTSGISVKCVARAFQLAISVLEYMLLIVYVQLVKNELHRS